VDRYANAAECVKACKGSRSAVAAVGSLLLLLLLLCRKHAKDEDGMASGSEPPRCSLM
jgi:hypothetical protein